jgi:hypothetical protein
MSLRSLRLCDESVVQRQGQRQERSQDNSHPEANVMDNQQGSMTLREGVNRMVDHATVAAGLDPSTAKLIKACDAVRQLRYPTIYDYRTAAYVIAIRKLAQSYHDLGLADTPVE